MCNILFAVWCAQLYLTFYYVLPSGVPQITDILLATLIGGAVLVETVRGGRVASRSEPRSLPDGPSYDAVAVRDTVRMCGVFVGFIVLVNTVWACLLSSSGGMGGKPSVELLTTSVYYLYNWLVCLLAASLLSLNPGRFSFWTMIAAFAAVMTQLVLAIAIGSTRTWEQSSRMVLFCNDPNQLCFAAILVSSLYYACSLPHRGRLRWLPLADFALATALVIVCWRAESRAGIIGAAALAFVMCARHVWFSIPIALLALLSSVLWSGSVLDRAQGYAENSRQIQELPTDRTEFLEDRQLTPLFDLSEYLVLGAGERGDRGLELLGMDTELHNSWALVLFAYGIGGFILLCSVFKPLVARGGATALLLLVPACLMASSIQGLRHTEFWTLLVMVSALACSRKPSPSLLRRRDRRVVQSQGS